MFQGLDPVYVVIIRSLRCWQRIGLLVNMRAGPHFWCGPADESRYSETTVQVQTLISVNVATVRERCIKEKLENLL